MTSFSGIRHKKMREARQKEKAAKKAGQSFDHAKATRSAVRSAKTEYHSQKSSSKGGVSRSGQRAKAKHEERIAIKNIRRTIIGKPLTKSYSDIQGDTQQKIAGIQSKYNVKRYTQGLERQITASTGNLMDRVKAKALTSFKQSPPVQVSPPILDRVKGMIGGAVSSLKGTMQAEQAKPFGQRIVEGVKKTILGPALGSNIGQNILKKGPAYPAITGAYESAKQRSLTPLLQGLKETGQRAKTTFEEQAFTGNKIAGVKEINPWFVAGFTEPLSKTGPLGKLIPKKSPLHAEARKYGSPEEFVKAKHEGVMYHGSPTGKFGDAEIHVGTKKAAQEALEARIGIPADGKGWTGEKAYGDTLMAGKKSLRSGKYGKYRETGFNIYVPENDFYLKDYPKLAKNAEFGNGEKIPLDVKPSVFPTRVEGGMTNSIYSPLTDTKANASIKAQLKRGTAKSGYYYKNISEDEGSISAVLPSRKHLGEVPTESQLTSIWKEANKTTTPKSGIPKKPPQEGGKTVYRGTMGTGEIENIQKGIINYTTEDTTAIGGMWGKSKSEVKKYAEGWSQSVGSATRKPKGNEGFIIEGRELKSGEIIPVSAENIKTGEVIRFSQTKSGIPKDAGEKMESFMKAKPTETAVSRTKPLSELPTEATPKQISKVPKESQKDISYLENIAKTKKGQVNPFINTKNLDISDEGKKFIDQTIEEAKPQLEESLGKTLTNKEAVEFAEKTSQVLNRTIGREQTKQFEAALLNTRRKLATMAESGTVDKEYIETLKTVKTLGTDIARKLQSFSIEAGTTSVTKQKILEAVLKVNDNTDEILKAAKGVDFTNANEAVNFYRKFIKPTAGEWIDVLRYNSMLSGPTTHIINTVSNLVNTAIVSPLEKGVTGTIDFLGGVAGKKREAFAGEALSYYKGSAQNIGEAAERFWGALTGKRAMTNLDLKFIPPASKGVKGGITKVLSIPTRFLEASDQFFTALAEGGERAALNLRQSKGVRVPLLEMKVKEKAAYRVFRQDLFSKEQGSVLDAVDQLTSKIMGLRNNPNPIVSTIAKFTVPFVKTPMNIFKQGLEYSPAGFSTIPGAKNKVEQLSKAIIGSTVFAGAATMLTSGRLTWGEPTSEKQRQEWRQAGIQPYSVKIGDKWYSYQKLAPGVAFPMAMVAAIDDMQKKKKLDDSTTEMILSSIAKYGEFLADQSYVKSIGDLLSAAKGGEAGIARVIGNYPQQLIPLRAFGGWLARLTDPEQRKIDNKAGFIDKQIQLLMMNIPGLSKKVPARLDVEGKPIPNRDKEINAISPVRVSTQDDRFMEYHLDAEQKRQTQREHQQLLDKAKEEVLKSGKSQTIGDTTVYLEDGEVKTTQGKNTVEAKQKYEEYKNLSDNEFKMRMIELKDQGEAQSEIADALAKYRRNDIAKSLGLEFEKEWSELGNQDKANVVMKKINSMDDVEKVQFFKGMVDRDFITDPLKKEVGVQLYDKMKGTLEEKIEGLNKFEDGSELRKTIVKVMFDDINQLKAGGKTEEATALVEKLSDADYETYKNARQTWRGGNTKKLDELMKVNTDEGVEFLRSLYKEEQDRILDNMTDEEWEVYKRAKEEYGTKTISELEKKSNEFYASINQDLYKRDAEYKAAVDAEIAKNTEAEQKLASTMHGNVLALSEQSSPVNLASINIGAGAAVGNNNPLNIKIGGATRHWIEEGLAQPGTMGKDGGQFIKFNDPETGKKAAEELLFESGVYSDLTVEEAARKWSNQGYGAEATGVEGNKKMSSLSADDRDTMLKAMAWRESNTTIGEKLASNPPVLNQPQVSLLRNVSSGKVSEEQATKTVLEEFNKTADTEAQKTAKIISLAPPKVPYNNIGYIPPEFYDPTSRIYGLIAALKVIREGWSGTAPEII